MAIVFGYVNWPGVVAPDNFVYTLSHGITPGIATLMTLPQSSPPDETGTLVFGDGVNGTITLPDCKVDKITARQDGTGRAWVLSIMDRRWKWKDLGQISGCYNQLDSRGKLIPRTIRSPQELAILCLQAMGETRYVIDLPPGMTRQEGEDAADGLKPDFGLTPETGTNPPVNWVQETPACALDRLCQQYGRHVIYRWSDDSVLIAIPGIGDMLPDRGSIALDAPGLDSPEVPTGVAVAGSETRFQVRLLLEPVALEFNDHFVPLDQVSYRPKPTAAKAQKVVFRFQVPTDGSAEWTVYLGPPDGAPLTDSAFPFVYDSAAAETPASVAAALAVLINASTEPDLANLVATAVGDNLEVECDVNGELFAYGSEVSSASSQAAASSALTTAAEHEDGRWWYSCPPIFANVKATDRLTKIESMRRAQESVFKSYRVMDIGVQPADDAEDDDDDEEEEGQETEDGEEDGDEPTPPPIIVPGYGEIARRQQLIIEPEQVETIVPLPGDGTLLDTAGNPIVAEYYNGYSHNKRSTCFGSILNALTQGAGYWRASDADGGRRLNAPETSQILIPFSVDANEQIITFSTHVYCALAAGALGAPPRLILQCAVTVRNEDNNALECFALSELLPNQSGNTNYAVRKYPDVQRNIVGEYDSADNITGSHDLEQDYRVRAQYYLDGLKRQYLWATSQYREWNGIEAMDLDGAIMQITWEIRKGCKTTASRNSEHSVNIPPYAARRRAEFLAPAQQQQVQQGANPQNVGPAINGPQNPPSS